MNPAAARLTARFDAATAADDWPALAAADRELAALLPQLAAGGIDCSALRAAHARAQDHCARTSSRLGERLAELGTHKEGWIAYAMSGDGGRV